MCTIQKDEMCHDKFVSGLKSESVRTELLKSHLRAYGTEKTLADIA